MAARKESEPAPPVQLANLARALAGDAPLARGYLVRGEERWFREAAIAEIAAAAARRGLEIVRHDGADPDVDLAGLLADLAAPPMFASARLVLVRGLATLLKKDEAPLVTAAAAFLRGGAVPGTLVLEAESLRVDHALAKAVAACGGTILTLRRLYDSPPPWERSGDPARTELVLWLLARAKAKGLRLDPRDAVYVAAATGNDLGALEGALADLARRKSGSVRETIGWHGTVSPFDLAEDMLRGDAAGAIAGIEGLFRSGMRAKDGSREVKPEVTLTLLLQSLRAKVREALALARAAEAGERLDRAAFRGPPRAFEEAVQRSAARRAEDWALLADDVAAIERRTRTSRTVDAGDLARLALRWRLGAETIRR